MSSSPSSVKQRSPKRASHKRTPLRERTPSQANEISSRLGKDSRSDQENLSIYSATPFPTKPAHVLLPSTLRSQRSAGPSEYGDNFGFSVENETGRSGDGTRGSRGGQQPTVRLKRSVKALRDLYEAQAEEASRPSTATSPPLRPTTAGSSRLRSISSSESLAGAFAWESIRKISSDDLSLLPTLPSGGRVVKRLASRSSFTSIAEEIPTISSPNFRVLGVTSSPKSAAFKDSSSPAFERFAQVPRSGDSLQDSSSSPNIVRLAPTSSIEQFRITDQSSSPNVIKLGTSSPLAGLPRSSNFTHSRSSSSSSRKRKRSDADGGRSFAQRPGARNPLASSPPVHRYAIPSSAAASDREIPSPTLGASTDDSSSVIQVLGEDGRSPDGSSLAETHSNLQAALLSSSPPSLQYPVVRAPPISQILGLVVPKRYSRSESVEVEGAQAPPRLSLVPSEGSRAISRPISDASFVPDDLDDYLHSDELAPASAYIINSSANQSTVRVVPDSDSEGENNSDEATDAVSALPLTEYMYKTSPTLRRTRSGNYVGSPGTSQAQLNSMKSFTQSRPHSFLSASIRPSSSSSTASASPLPTWARRYYSGVYRDSFQFLYANGSHVSLHNMASSVPALIPAPSTFAPSSRPETSRSNSWPSLRSVHQAIVRPKLRPRLEARKSHSLPGVGPLVSNPVRGPATAALESASITIPRQSYPPSRSGTSHYRTISSPLPSVDPRSHWAGIVEIHEQQFDDGRGSSFMIRHHSYNYDVSRSRSESDNNTVMYYPGGNGQHRRWSASPHLHHDHRLNTGSTASRGFGFPFNTKARWSAPSLVDESGPFNLRTAQIACFTLGFILPVTWFVAAFLPLPKRPTTFGDLEKEVRSRQQSQLFSQTPSQYYSHPPSQYYSQSDLERVESMDILERLRLERQLAGMAELSWQNARWWRNLNRWMCAVGVVVCVLIVVLAVLGTTRNW